MCVRAQALVTDLTYLQVASGAKRYWPLALVSGIRQTAYRLWGDKPGMFLWGRRRESGKSKDCGNEEVEGWRDEHKHILLRRFWLPTRRYGRFKDHKAIRDTYQDPFLSSSTVFMSVAL